MRNRESLKENILRTALGPTDDCPTVEELESLASGEAIAVDRWKGHLQVCGYCQTELHLLQTFLSQEPLEATQNANQAAELLEKKSKEIFKRAFPMPAPAPWWKSVFTVRRMAQASFAAAAVLLLLGAVVFFRSPSSQPELDAKNRTGPEVFRSSTFVLLSPSGDLEQPPTQIRWEQVPKAAAYQVRLLEVDRSEVWKGNTTDTRIEMPEAIRARIVPAKTLFAEVTAFDSSGNQIATTELVRFRLVQNRK
jgi:hypothetical protein